MFKFKSSYSDLEKKIGYKFRKKSLLVASLTHRSYRFETQGVDEDNQRLEFLGDAVLDLLAASYFYNKHSDFDEGILTTLRSQITSGVALKDIAKDIGLGDDLLIGKGEEASGGRERSSNLEDALEALIGAVYLDGGMKAADKMFNKVFAPRLENMKTDIWKGNPKGKLQTYAQKYLKDSPGYKVVSRDGPAHALVFTVEVVINGKAMGTGVGSNKQMAEGNAAKQCLKKLNIKN